MSDRDLATPVRGRLPLYLGGAWLLLAGLTEFLAFQLDHTFLAALTAWVGGIFTAELYQQWQLYRLYRAGQEDLRSDGDLAGRSELG